MKLKLTKAQLTQIEVGTKLIVASVNRQTGHVEFDIPDGFGPKCPTCGNPQKLRDDDRVKKNI